MTIEKPELIKRRPIPKQIRDRVFERDSEGKYSRLCPICGINEIKVNTCECAHIISWVHCHKDDESDLISICKDCNGKMNNMDMDKFKLLYYPTRRQELEKGITDGKNYINKTKKDIIEFSEELKTLPKDSNIWSFILEARRLHGDKITETSESDSTILKNDFENKSKPKKIIPFVNNVKRRGVSDIQLLGFTFNGKEYKTDKYVDIVRRVCDQLSEIHKKDFEKIALSMNKYFSKNEDELRIAYLIPNTKIFVERNMGDSETTIKNVTEIIEHFGYSKNDLIINRKI